MRALALAAASLAWLACSDPAAPPADAAPASPGGFTPPTCEVDFGRTFLFDQISILPAGEGVDITGDGVPDNLLGRIGPLSNPTIADAIASGTGLFLLDVTGWSAPPADDDEIGIALYLGVDADSPPDPSNNASGEGRFHVIDRQFDVECNPLTRRSGQVAGGVITASPDVWQFIVSGVGTLEFHRIQLDLAIEGALDGLDGRLGNAWTVCSLSGVTGPLFAGGSLLDVVVNNVREPVPDLDLDGDGLEQLIGDGDAVTGCLDGDGTPIDGPACACDPRIADAYSVSVAIHGVPAVIDGILYRP